MCQVDKNIVTVMKNQCNFTMTTPTEHYGNYSILTIMILSYHGYSLGMQIGTIADHIQCNRRSQPTRVNYTFMIITPNTSNISQI